MSLIASMTEQQLVFRDAHGDIVDLEDWSADLARDHAREMGLTLTDEHLKVLDFLRLYYLDGGSAESATGLLRALEQRFAAEGGGRYLFQLFPGGPLNQGMALAGLPSPGLTADRSFGSVR